MQAIAIHEHGGPEVLGVQPMQDPEPADGAVIVELRAAAINRRDLLIRSGIGPAYRFDLPLVLGSDGAGVRRDTGEEVVILPSLRWGEDQTVAGPGFGILGGPEDGTYAELVRVPQANVYPKPRGMSWEQAAALPLAAVTAYRALFTVGELTSGQRLVVLGVGSGVSLAAIQIATSAGVHVAATSSSEDKIALARTLGADIAVNYRHEGWVQELSQALAPGADVVLDSVGSTWPQSIELLRPGGALVACGGTGGAVAELDVRAVYLQQKRILGTKMGSPADFTALLQLVSQGAVTPVIDSVRPLAEAADGHRRLDTGEHLGKLVLSVP